MATPSKYYLENLRQVVAAQFEAAKAGIRDTEKYKKFLYKVMSTANLKGYAKQALNPTPWVGNSAYKDLDESDLVNLATNSAPDVFATFIYSSEGLTHNKELDSGQAERLASSLVSLKNRFELELQDLPADDLNTGFPPYLSLSNARNIIQKNFESSYDVTGSNLDNAPAFVRDFIANKYTSWNNLSDQEQKVFLSTFAASMFVAQLDVRGESAVGSAQRYKDAYWRQVATEKLNTIEEVSSEAFFETLDNYEKLATEVLEGDGYSDELFNLVWALDGSGSIASSPQAELFVDWLLGVWGEGLAVSPLPWELKASRFGPFEVAYNILEARELGVQDVFKTFVDYQGDEGPNLRQDFAPLSPELLVDFSFSISYNNDLKDLESTVVEFGDAVVSIEDEQLKVWYELHVAGLQGAETRGLPVLVAEKSRLSRIFSDLAAGQDTDPRGPWLPKLIDVSSRPGLFGFDTPDFEQLSQEVSEAVTQNIVSAAESVGGGGSGPSGSDNGDSGNGGGDSGGSGNGDSGNGGSGNGGSDNGDSGNGGSGNGGGDTGGGGGGGGGSSSSSDGGFPWGWLIGGLAVGGIVYAALNRGKKGPEPEETGRVEAFSASGPDGEVRALQLETFPSDD